jgi:hypothetical protein
MLGNRNLIGVFVLFSYPAANADIHIIPKIESADSIPNLQSIIAASDGVRPFTSAVFFDTRKGSNLTERERTCKWQNVNILFGIWPVAMNS